MKVNQIITGNAFSVLRGLPDDIVQTCVTSPPYYGLRDYGVEGQIGLEETPEAYVAKLVEIFREVKRVLRNDGTLWLNLGDSYAGSWGNYAPRGIKGEQRPQTEEGKRWEREAYSDTSFLPPTANPSRYGLKPKDLIGIPWMVAFALRSDGWYLRSDIIWNKPTAMPESVTDRPTKAHEYLFLFAKSQNYYYDCDAIREPLRPKTFTTYGSRNTPGKGNDRLGKVKSDNWNSTVPEKKPKLAADGSLAGANKRTVWTVASQPYSEAHFATFPPRLIEPCILAGTSPRACEHCLAPWERVTEHAGIDVPRGNQDFRVHRGVNRRGGGVDRDLPSGYAPTITTTGWEPTCSCSNEGIGRCIILDPFVGAGTTALVASQFGRDWLGIELNPAYATLAMKRIATIQPRLWEVAI